MHVFLLIRSWAQTTLNPISSISVCTFVPMQSPLSLWESLSGPQLDFAIFSIFHYPGIYASNRHQRGNNIDINFTLQIVFGLPVFLATKASVCNKCSMYLKYIGRYWLVPNTSILHCDTYSI